MTSRVDHKKETGLCLLSIDGGGIRGLSPLLMLKEVLFRIQQQEQLAEMPRPCEVFDLAGGTNTGGLIVIMLFRLRMSVEDAINAYVRLVRHVFSEQISLHPSRNSRTARLEEAVTAIIQQSLDIEMEEEARYIRMLDENRGNCFVCAVPSGDIRFPTVFRTWTPRANPTYNCTIIEAVRATTAFSTLFEDIEIGEQTKQRYIGEPLGCNNPVKHVIDEARSTYPERPIHCVVSLGTGAANIISLDRRDAFQRLLRMDLNTTLKDIAKDCEQTSEETARDLSAQSIPYFRLNVNQGQAASEKLEDVQLHTEQYLKGHQTNLKVDQLVRALRESPCSTEKASLVSATELSPAEWQAFKDLGDSISVNAYHDSQARSTSSDCLLGTRKGQINIITNWIEAQDTKKPLFVVLGPAGSGKSSLLSTIAQICKKKGSYAAGFFFSGTDTQRNTCMRLITTISYQICEAIPQLRPHVARVVKNQPSILSRSLLSQLDNLLLGPLSQLQLPPHRFSFHPRIIIIDALDECGNEHDQKQVIKTLTEALSHKSFPFRCLLSSRFDWHIQSILSCGPTQPLVNTGVTLGLAEEEEMDDIRSYLETKVIDIRTTHHIRAGWPDCSNIETIVKRSGGQFIYAATVIRYIESPHHDPRDRLQHILGISIPKLGTNPFEALDDIYRDLMSSVDHEHRDAALEILGIELVKSDPQCWIPLTLIWRSFFEDHFAKLGVDFVFAPLASVLKYENCHIKFYHQSFAEFLRNPTRSGQFSVEPTKWQIWIVSRLVQHFYEHKDINQYDVDDLIEEAKPGTDLHKAIAKGLELVLDYPKRLPDGGDFNIWPFVTWGFFRALQFHISIEKMANVFLERGEDFLPLPILIVLAPIHKLNNSFLLFELCVTIAVLKKTGFIQHDESWHVCLSSDRLLSYMTYLADYFHDQRRSGKNILLAEDYQSATLCCLWYLQSPRSNIYSSLQEHLRSLRYLPDKFGILTYLRDPKANITRGALDVLFSLLPRSPPSTYLIASLKEPFDDDVISKNPSSSRKARNLIHEYLMLHDTTYRGGFFEDNNDANEDVPLPHFDRFLIHHYEYYNSYARRNG